jgi:hypothetical protein
MLRVTGWVAVTGLVTLVARTLAYALARPDPRAVALNGLTGGPTVVTVSLVSLGLALVVSTAVLWIAVVAVRERRRLRPERIAPRDVSLPRLAARAVLLFVSACALFAGFESYLHERTGLGFHGISCLAGPVHRNVVAILAALSLVAAALSEALAHLVAWMRAAIRLLRARRPRAASDPAPIRRPSDIGPFRRLATCLVARPRAPPGFAPSR